MTIQIHSENIHHKYKYLVKFLYFHFQHHYFSSFFPFSIHPSNFWMPMSITIQYLILYYYYIRTLFTFWYVNFLIRRRRVSSSDNTHERHTKNINLRRSSSTNKRVKSCYHLITNVYLTEEKYFSRGTCVYFFDEQRLSLWDVSTWRIMM